MASLSDLYSVATALVGAIMLGGCFSPTPVESDEGSSSGSSGNPAAVCVPGETQNCLCLGNQDGVQACNENGNGYGACECPDDGVTSGPMATTTTDPGDSSGGDTTGGGEDTSASTSTGEEETTTGPLPPHEGPYGHCFDSECDLAPDETCAATMMPDTNICIYLGCESVDDCPPIEGDITAQIQCTDVTGDKVGDCILTCTAKEDCFRGSICLGLDPEAGASGICVWPTPS